MEWADVEGEAEKTQQDYSWDPSVLESSCWMCAVTGRNTRFEAGEEESEA